MAQTPKIIYTLTDEAPALATRSLLPVIDAYTDSAGIRVETRDISLAARIIASFPDYLNDDQRMDDHLAELGEMTSDPATNIIKLPNISASTPQLKDAIRELQQRATICRTTRKSRRTTTRRSSRAAMIRSRAAR